VALEVEVDVFLGTLEEELGVPSEILGPLPEELGDPFEELAVA
jgi:hypothetical protein